MFQFFKIKKKSFLISRWTIKDIVNNAFFISLWPLFGFFALPLRILDVNIPFFYFLIWLIGFFFTPYHAFVVSFLGHLMFDLTWSFSPFFIFIWLASGLSSMLIAFYRHNYKILFFISCFIPIIYILAFCGMAYIFWFSKFWIFFQAFPHITITLIFINPIFNFFVFWSFMKNPSLKKLLLFVQTKKKIIFNK